MLQFTLPATHDDLVAENLEAYIEYTVLVSQIAAVGPITATYNLPRNRTSAHFDVYLKSGDRMNIIIYHEKNSEPDVDAMLKSLQGARDYLTQSLGDYMKEKRL